MATLHPNSQQNPHDGQKHYQNSNEVNPDNVRNDTRDRVYKEHDESHTNDANFDLDKGQVSGDMDYRDKEQNDDSQ